MPQAIQYSSGPPQVMIIYLSWDSTLAEQSSLRIDDTATFT